MEIAENTEYDGMASLYQSLEIARLNETLKGHGIADGALRKSICTAFFTASGRFLDDGWFRYAPWFADRRVYPQLCFAEKRPPAERQVGHAGEIGTLYIPREGFDFAYEAGARHTEGSLCWYFEERDEDISEVDHGIEHPQR